MANSNFRQVLEFVLESKLDPAVRQALEVVRELGDAGEISDEQIGGLLDTMARSADLQAAINGYRQAGSALKSLTAEQRAAVASVQELATAEKSSAATLAEKRAALSAAEATLRSFSDGSRGYLGTTKQVAAAQKEAKTSVSALTKEVREAERVHRSDAAALGASRKALSDTSAQRERALASVRQYGGQLKAAGVDTARLSGEEKRLAAEAQKAGNELRTLAGRHAETARATRENAAAAKQAEGAFSGLTGKLKGLAAAAAAYLGLRQLRDTMLSILKVGDEFAGLEQRFNQAFGSVEAGARAFNRVRDLARDMPDSFDSIADAALKLKSFGLDPLDGSLQALIDQNAALGGGQERLNGLILAVGQAWAKQKLQGEEILQLVERGVPVWDLLAQATGKSAQELQKLSEQGKLGRDVIAALLAEIGKSSEGAAAQGLSRLSALWTKLTDVARDFFDRIADSGPIDYFRGQLQALQDRMRQMDADGSLDALAKRIGDSITAIGSAVASGVTFIGTYIREITALGAALAAAKIADLAASAARGLTALRLSLAGLLGPVGLVAGAITALVVYFRDTDKSAADADPAIRGMADALDQLSQSTDENRESNIKATQARLESLRLTNQITEAALAEARAEAELHAQRDQSLEVANGTVALERERGEQLKRNVVALEQAAEAQRKAITAAEGAIVAQRGVIESLSLEEDWTKRVAAAFEQLGIKSTKSLKEAAAAAERNVDVIALAFKRGEVAIGDVRAAFEQWAKAERAAVENGTARQKALIEATILMREAQLGLRDAHDETGKAAEESARKQLAMLQSLRSGVAAAAQAIATELAQALQKGSDPASIEALRSELKESEDQIRALNTEIAGAESALRKMAEGGGDAAGRVKAASEQMATGFVNVEKVANTADKAISEMGQGAGGAAAGIRDVLAGIEQSVSSLGDAAKAEFDQLIHAMSGGDGVIETSGLTMARAIQRVADAAEVVISKHTLAQEAAARHAAAMAYLQEHSEEAGEALYRMGFTVDDLRNGTITASDAMRALGNQRMDRLRPELEGVAGALEQIEEGARSAVSELAEMNREYEKSRLQREGNEKALADLKLKEEIARIEELRQRGGAAAAAEAAEARRYAEAEHAARLREIEEEKRARKEAEQEVRRERERAASGGPLSYDGAGSGGRAGGVGGNAPAQPPQQTVMHRVEIPFGGQTFGINVGGANDAATLRNLLQALLRAAASAGMGGGTIR